MLKLESCKKRENYNMRFLLTANSSAEAHMISHMLQGQGIKAEVHGDYLQGAVGGVPLAGHIKISVPEEDFEKAAEVLRAFEQAQPIQKRDKKDPKKNSVPIYILSFLAGSIIGAITMDFYNRPPLAYAYYGKNGEFIDEYDYNNDGLTDMKWVVTKKGLPIQSEADRNFDGNFDEVIYYNRSGLTKKSETDDNFDGKFETTHDFDTPTNSRMKTDRDLDGNTDHMTVFENSIPIKSYFYRDGLHIPTKIEYYNSGFLETAEFDSDEDGKLDTRYYYDEFYEIEKSETIE